MRLRFVSKGKKGTITYAVKILRLRDELERRAP
jgi:hypothetical protein